MSTLEAIKNIFDKNLEQMKDNFNSSLSSRAIEKLDEKKLNIAQNLFKSVEK